MAANLVSFLLAALIELRAFACGPFPAISEATWSGLGLGSESGLELGLGVGLGSVLGLDSRGDLAYQDGLCLLVRSPLGKPRAPDERTVRDLPVRVSLVEPDGGHGTYLLRRDGIEPG